MRHLAPLAAVALFGMYAFPGSALGANAVVNAQAGSWDPPAVNIADGETVTWNNAGQGSHNVRIAGESAALVAVGNNWTGIQREFNRPGTAIFYCEVHGSPSGSGMSGAVNVAGISGRVVRDSDGSGTITAADEPAPAVTVRVYDALAHHSNPDATPPLDTTTTDGNGLYEFDPPMPAFGYARVIAEPPGGFAPPAQLDFPSGSTSADGDKDFLLEGTGSVSGTVWNDVNGNGVHDAPEVGRAGVTVSLNGKRTATTAGDGTYSFSEAIPGVGAVSVTPPSGFGVVGSASQPINLQNPDYTTAGKDFFLQELKSIGGVPAGDEEQQPTPVPVAPVIERVPSGNGTAGNDLLKGTAGADRILGFGGADVLLGLRGDDSLDGGAGNDTLDGGPGNDSLKGGPGNDSMTGGPGNDRLDGGPGADRLAGSGGADKLIGGKGKDTVNGGSGNDVVDARDGVAELVRCGPGRDRVKADRRDRLHGCEKRLR